jgi:hypothetical protein
MIESGDDSIANVRGSKASFDNELKAIGAQPKV